MNYHMQDIPTDVMDAAMVRGLRAALSRRHTGGLFYREQTRRNVRSIILELRLSRDPNATKTLYAKMRTF